MPREMTTGTRPIKRAEVEAAINQQITSDIRERDLKQKQLLPYYKSEKQVTLSIPPMYAPYFGKRMLVAMNGITLWVPVDGRRFTVPETFAAEIYRRMAATNDIVNKQERIAAVGAFFETAPGDIKVFN